VLAAEPHAPFCGVLCVSASHTAVVPLFDPTQSHTHGPLPPTLDPVPALHKLVVGAEDN
jgi:hypothetical protein